MNAIEYLSAVNHSSKDTYYQNTARNLFLNQEFYKICDIFSKENIPLIPLKGIGLIQGIYPDIGGRFIGDIDILIKAEDVARASSLFERLEYQSPKPFFNPKTPYSAYLNSLAFSKPARIPYFVHLHWHLLNSTLPLFMYRINMQEIWEGAKLEQYNNRNMLMMIPEHLMIYLSIHAFKHCFKKIALFGDIQKAIEFYQDRIEWQEIIRISGRWNAILPLYYSLYFTSEILHADLPMDLLDRLRPGKISRAEQKMVSLILKNKTGSQHLIYPLYLKMAGGILNKLKFVFLSFFIPPRQLGIIHPVKYGCFIFLAYLKRLAWACYYAFRLLCKYLAR